MNPYPTKSNYAGPSGTYSGAVTRNVNDVIVDLRIARIQHLRAVPSFVANPVSFILARPSLVSTFSMTPSGPHSSSDSNFRAKIFSASNWPLPAGEMPFNQSKYGNGGDDGRHFNINGTEDAYNAGVRLFMKTIYFVKQMTSIPTEPRYTRALYTESSKPKFRKHNFCRAISLEALSWDTVAHRTASEATLRVRDRG